MRVVCAWCGRHLGSKPGEGTTHGICPECSAKETAKLEEDRKARQAENEKKVDESPKKARRSCVYSCRARLHRMLDGSTVARNTLLDELNESVLYEGGLEDERKVKAAIAKHCRRNCRKKVGR